MNIYLVKYNGEFDWDTNDAYVCYAIDEDKAWELRLLCTYFPWEREDCTIIKAGISDTTVVS